MEFLNRDEYSAVHRVLRDIANNCTAFLRMAHQLVEIGNLTPDGLLIAHIVRAQVLTYLKDNLERWASEGIEVRLIPGACASVAFTIGAKTIRMMKAPLEEWPSSGDSAMRLSFFCQGKSPGQPALDLFTANQKLENVCFVWSVAQGVVSVKAAIPDGVDAQGVMIPSETFYIDLDENEGWDKWTAVDEGDGQDYDLDIEEDKGDDEGTGTGPN